MTPPSPLKVSSRKMTDKCISCGVFLVEAGYTTFVCPGCGEVVIGRCRRCRDQAIKYKCSNCDFEGP